MCIGKGLTGGYMTLSATLTTKHIAETISQGEADWQSNIQRIEAQLRDALQPLQSLNHVHDVRVLGAIGVVELTVNVDMKTLQQEFVRRGIWIRPFGKLVYVMPPYVITAQELKTLLEQLVEVVKGMEQST
ncbi:unnamed protein product [Oppiella nova]|uniref:Adenosylmethionine-8-amino-7-oxononanoate aminotransferase n=1 Tax=Oppiella nova TaxID=334625 RepID=A0A7R9Q9N4_9ACAR|nr:unnamed protein product [Oppiella nova]CAG2158131.1 unnamed protein product [Oppiella nova]